jgi:hypothetical protein
LLDTDVGPGQAAGTADILLELDWESEIVWRWEHSAFHHDMCRMPLTEILLQSFGTNVMRR